MSEFTFTLWKATSASRVAVMYHILFLFFFSFLQTFQRKLHFLSHYSILFVCLKMGKTTKMTKRWGFGLLLSFSSEL